MRITGHILTMRSAKVSPVGVQAFGRCSCGQVFGNSLPNADNEEAIDVATEWAAHIQDVRLRQEARRG